MNKSLSFSFIEDFSKKEQMIANKIKEDDDFIYSSDSFIELVSEMTGHISKDLSNYKGMLTEENLSHLSLDNALDIFFLEEWPEDYLGYLSYCSKWMCESFGVSFQVYGASAFAAIWFIAKGEQFKASQYLIMCMQPILSVMRIGDISKERGKLGGRPEHPRKSEAIKIARQKWNVMEYASLNIVATAVKHHLDNKYKDSPSLPAIKKWLKNAEFRPKKSVK
ncbi:MULTISPECIES: hypothetical protein [Yersinia]|nr:MULTISPECIES: hypothetical protein [Yersinia]MCB5320077.1 hypothetical protein [Yersinia massiliensis]MDA5473893.1 hypothetical protein [Yersinia kristensenii]MDA5507112.1 hypothetical protein [Yersinia kristensenii]NIK96031.1 hypothetical protein [Yersinia kristensenii]NIL09023.1 hypothetical protein [Yersinia kristensenii]